MTNRVIHTNKDNIGRDSALELLSSTFPDLKEKWNVYKQTEYKDYPSERLDYIDIGVITRYIVDKVKAREIAGLDELFNRVEIILTKGDHYTKELIVIGFLEGIQNLSGWSDIDYHKEYDKWLKPATRKAWNDIIYFGESEESQKKWEEMQSIKRNNGS